VFSPVAGTGTSAAARERRHGQQHTVALARALALVAALALALVGAPAAHADDPPCTITWDGGASDSQWGSASNWSGDTVPVATDVVCLPTGTAVTLNGASAVAASIQGAGAALTFSGGSLTVSDSGAASALGTLTFNGGSLNGAADVHVATSLAWTGGAMTGSGATVIDAGATATINPGGGSSSVSLDQRTLSNHGSATLADGNILAANGATLRNAGTLTLNSEADWLGVQVYDYGGSPRPQLVNAVGGTIRKTAGTGTTGIGVAVDNEGTLDVQTGRLELARGGGPSTAGTWAASGAGSSIAFRDGDTVLGAGARLGGAIRVTGGTVTAPDLHIDGSLALTGGTLTLTGGSSASETGGYAQTGGTLSGAGELDVAGAFTFNGGTMSGSGSTILRPDASGTIDPGDGSSSVVLDQRTLSNQGTLTFSSGTIRASNGATLRNSATLKLNSQTSFWGAQVYDDGGSPRPRLVNAAGGTIVKDAGGGGTAVGVALVDEGTIDGQTGPLLFPNNTTTATFADGATLKGDLRLTGVDAAAGDVDASAATLQLSSGTLSVDDGKTLTAATIAQSGGTQTGPGTLHVEAALTWTGGAMTGTGTTVLATASGSSIAPGDGSSSVVLDQRTLSNQGTLTLTNGTLRGGNGATLRNSGTFAANSETSFWGAQVYDNGGGPRPQLVNTATGTIVKNAGSGTTGLGWVLDDAGTLDAATGRFALSMGDDAATLEDGATLAGDLLFNGANVTAVGDVAAHAAAVTLSTGTLTADDGATLAVGALSQSGGTLGGAGDVTVDTTLTWTQGTMSGSGATILLAGGSGTIDPGDGSSAVQLQRRTLSNRGDLTLARGTVLASSAATIANSGTLDVNTQADWYGADIYAAGGDDPSLVNIGAVRKTAGDGSSRIGILFDNEGTVDARTGRLDFGGGGGPSTSGTWAASGADTSVQFSGGSFALGAGTQASGALRVTDGGVTVPDLQLDGTLTVTGGTLAVTDDATTSHADGLTQSGGTVTGAGTLALADGLAWSGGTMAGSGETALGADGTGTIAAGGGSSSVALEHRTLSNAGDLTFSSGTVLATSGATLRNSGTLDYNSENDWFGAQLYDNGGSPRPRIVNTASGTIRKTSGTGTTAFGLTTDNAGAIDGGTGRYRFGQSTAPVTLEDDSTLAGAITLGGAPVTAHGVDGEDADVNLEGGTLDTAAGADALLGRLRQTGGATGGAGNLHVDQRLQLLGGTQGGAGTTTLDPGGVGTINPGGGSSSISLDGRTLAVKGTMSHDDGTILMTNASSLDITGRFAENSQANWFGDAIHYNGGPLPSIAIRSGGQLAKDSGTGTTSIDVPADNEGEVHVGGSGIVRFATPDGTPVPCTSGGWSTDPDGSKVLLSDGPHCMAPDTTLSGEFRLDGGSRLTVANIDGDDADFDLAGGTLDVTDTTTPTTLRGLSVSGGTLTGDGEVDVHGIFSWTGGQMSGAGSTVVAPGVASSIDAGGGSGSVLLDRRTLTLDGPTTFPEGTLRTANGATLANGGLFSADAENNWFGGAFHDDGGSAPSKFLNKPGGTLRKLTGTGTTGVEIPFDNQGAVDAATGDLRFSRGGIPASAPPVIDDPLLCPQPRNPQTGSWTAGTSGEVEFGGPDCFVLGGGTVMTGTIHNTGATILAGAVQGLGAIFYHEGGKLVFEDRSIAAVLGTLHLSADLDGPGEVDICDTLAWQGGAMRGTGSTVLCPGGTGTISPPGSGLTSGRVLVNAGDLSWNGGSLALNDGAYLFNTGTFHVNSESGSISGDGSARIVNTGTSTKDVGTGTTYIGVHVDNPGTIERVTGTLIIEGQQCQANSSGTGEQEDPGGTGDEPEPSAYPPDFQDPTESPGEDWEWHGKPPEGGDEGAWFNPETGESWHPDLEHAPPVPPHWDYTKRGGGGSWRWNPDDGFTRESATCGP
jgi:hypothetical protein